MLQFWANLFQKKQQGRVSLMLFAALEQKNHSLFRNLLAQIPAHLINFSICGPDGVSPLLHQAIKNHETELSQCLLEFGADTGIRDGYGRTALHIAVSNADARLVELLIKSGADVNVRDSLGDTPLHQVFWTQKKYNMNVVELLLNAGADPRIKNRNGKSAMDKMEDYCCSGGEDPREHDGHQMLCRAVERLELKRSAFKKDIRHLEKPKNSKV